ncbi:uncharacterized protein LOC143891938 [Tasmannia lanceolata]|uniref:uncharacterized protein LOC143891938 n=1 Tax=Tasmannia lanceolata TaxID=3420 RepID=UPI00406447CF
MSNMKNEEAISEMFTRFINIINELKSLGREYSSIDLVNKILRSLPTRWDSKVASIQEAKDISKPALEELSGSLITYEMVLNNRATNEKTPRRRESLSKQRRIAKEKAKMGDLALFNKRLNKFLR